MESIVQALKQNEYFNNLDHPLTTPTPDDVITIINQIQIQQQKHVHNLETHANKLRCQNLRLKKQIKDLQQKQIINGSNHNNTASEFMMASQFKDKWETLIKQNINITFAEWFDQPTVFAENVLKVLKEIYSKVQQKLNSIVTRQLQILQLDSSFFKSLMRSQLKLLQDNWRNIFKVPSSISSFQIFNGSQQQAVELLQRFHELCIYMQLQPQQIILAQPHQSVFSKKEQICIDGFIKQNEGVTVLIQAKKGQISLCKKGVIPFTNILEQKQQSNSKVQESVYKQQSNKQQQLIIDQKVEQFKQLQKQEVCDQQVEQRFKLIVDNRVQATQFKQRQDQFILQLSTSNKNNWMSEHSQEVDLSQLPQVHNFTKQVELIQLAQNKQTIQPFLNFIEKKKYKTLQEKQNVCTLPLKFDKSKKFKRHQSGQNYLNQLTLQQISLSNWNQKLRDKKLKQEDIFFSGIAACINDRRKKTMNRIKSVSNQQKIQKSKLQTDSSRSRQFEKEQSKSKNIFDQFKQQLINLRNNPIMSLKDEDRYNSQNRIINKSLMRKKQYYQKKGSFLEILKEDPNKNRQINLKQYKDEPYPKCGKNDGYGKIINQSNKFNLQSQAIDKNKSTQWPEYIESFILKNRNKEDNKQQKTISFKSGQSKQYIFNDLIKSRNLTKKKTSKEKFQNLVSKSQRGKQSFQQGIKIRLRKQQNRPLKPNHIHLFRKYEQNQQQERRKIN